METRSMNDQELITRYMQGSEKCIEVLVRRHKSRLFSYIFNQLRDRDLANDVFQDTFMKAIHTIKMGNYKDEGKFINWLTRIAHNLIMDHFRNSQKIPTIANNDEYDIFSTIKIFDKNIEEQIINDQITMDVRRLVDQLPEEQREVVMLRHFSDMSFKDIAETTNCSINTALGRMRYAIMNLRKMVEENRIVLTA